LSDLLSELNNLVFDDETSEEFHELYNAKYNSDLDTSNQEFWEEHY